MSKPERAYDCPKCGREGKCYYNLEKNIGHCKVCNSTIYSWDLFGRGGSVPIRKLNFLDFVVGFPERGMPVGELSPPPEAMLLSSFSREYLIKERRIDESLLDYLPIYTTSNGILFMFPYEEFWQLRVWPSFRPPAWENPDSAPRKISDGVLYRGSLHYNPNEPLVLVEGILDCLALAPYNQTIAYLGSLPNENQMETLATEGFSQVFWLPDGDIQTKVSPGKVWDTKDLLRSYFIDGVQCHILLESEDPASLNNRDRKQTIKNFRNKHLDFR